jgi:hypothetical protein
MASLNAADLGARFCIHFIYIHLVKLFSPISFVEFIPNYLSIHFSVVEIKSYQSLLGYNPGLGIG